MRPRVLRIVGVVATAGCTSLGGLTGGVGEDAGADAGSDGMSVVPPPPSGDDAGDAGEGGDAAVFRCATLSPVPAFCADFDEATSAGALGNPITSGGGAVDLDDATYVSPGRSLRVMSPAIDAGGVQASFHRTFGPAAKTQIVVEADMRIDSADPTSSNTIVIGTSGYALALFLGLSGAKLRETIPADAGPQFVATDRTTPPGHAWFHLRLVVAIAPGASTATVSYDGLAQSAVPIAIDQYPGGSWFVDIGQNFTTPPDDGHLLHFDDLVIDAK